jgi:hypothetical protein
MAFLDNSGDIILDAVLTDTGRMRLAKGDGSFQITSFALGDDEIDYSLFNVNAATANQDLSILQTPVFEAFTNNASSMKSKLLSIADPNLLYLPVIQINEVYSGDITAKHGDGVFVVAVNSDTETKFNTSRIVMYGENPSSEARYVRCDQGLDTSSISPSHALNAALLETQYAIEVDNRLLSIVSSDGSTAASVSFIDDDDIATYYLSQASNPSFVYENPETSASVTTQVIDGPRGTVLEFKFASTLDVIDGSYFDELGSTKVMTDDFGSTGASSTYKYIDTFVRIQGMTTGYSIDLPVRLIRFQTD